MIRKLILAKTEFEKFHLVKESQKRFYYCDEKINIVNEIHKKIQYYQSDKKI